MLCFISYPPFHLDRLCTKPRHIDYVARLFCSLVLGMVVLSKFHLNTNDPNLTAKVGLNSNSEGIPVDNLDCKAADLLFSPLRFHDLLARNSHPTRRKRYVFMSKYIPTDARVGLFHLIKKRNEFTPRVTMST